VFFDVHHFLIFFYDLIRKMEREREREREKEREDLGFVIGSCVSHWVTETISTTKWFWSTTHRNHFRSKMVLEYNSQKPFISSSSNCVSPKLNDGNGSRSLVFLPAENH